MHKYKYATSKGLETLFHAIEWECRLTTERLMSISALICSSDKHSCVSAYLIQGLSAHTDDIQCCLGVWTVAACERHTHTRNDYTISIRHNSAQSSKSHCSKHPHRCIWCCLCGWEWHLRGRRLCSGTCAWRCSVDSKERRRRYVGVHFLKGIIPQPPHKKKKGIVAALTLRVDSRSIGSIITL